MSNQTDKTAEKEGRAIPKEKPMTYKEGIEALDDLIGTPAPIDEAISLKKQFATVGDPDTGLPPELEAAVEDLQNRTKDAGKSKK